MRSHQIRHDTRRALGLGAAAFLSLVVYVFILSAGTFTKWHSYLRHVDLLAEGFRAGHLYLAKQPPPALLDKPDPLDPANMSLWTWDASLYRGRFYEYWGPVPAALLALGKIALRIHEPVGDEILAFCFAAGRLVFGMLVLELLGRRLFPRAPPWLVALSGLMFALASPTPFVLARGAVYEVSILSGQLFLVGGLYFALRALLAERGTLTLLATASTFWALAGASRASLLPATWILAVLALLALRLVPSRPRLQRPAVALVVPLLLGASLLALYNYARFDSVLEMGANYQMSNRHFEANLLWVPANVYSYLFRGLAYECRFPFVMAPWNLGAAGIPHWLALRPGYLVTEPVAGALNSCPWVLLGGAAAVGLGRTERALRAARWLSVWAFTVAASVTLLPALFMWAATMRYQLDVMSGATLLAALGAFSLWEGLMDRPAWPRLALSALILGLALFSLFIGVMLGFNGYYKHFFINNPALFHTLQQRLSVCP